MRLASKNKSAGRCWLRGQQRANVWWTHRERHREWSLLVFKMVVPLNMWPLLSELLKRGTTLRWTLGGRRWWSVRWTTCAATRWAPLTIWSWWWWQCRWWWWWCFSQCSWGWWCCWRSWQHHTTGWLAQGWRPDHTGSAQEGHHPQHQVFVYILP